MLFHVGVEPPYVRRGVRAQIRQQRSRSLRIEYSICARNNFSSGAIDGRPTLAYMVSNRRDKRLSTSSTMSRMVHSG